MRKSIEVLVDDIDESHPASTVNFALGGEKFSIDLNEGNVAQLNRLLEEYDQVMGMLQPFLNVARPYESPAVDDGDGDPDRTKDLTGEPVSTEEPVKPKRRRKRAVPTDAQIREWATGEGLSVSNKGRVSKVIREAYDAAH